MKKMNMFASVVLSGVLLLTGCNEEGTQKQNTPTDGIEYNFSYWKVEMVNDKDEVYLSQMYGGKDWAIIAENKEGVKKGDFVRVTEDSEHGDFIASEKLEEDEIITLEDGSKVTEEFFE